MQYFRWILWIDMTLNDLAYSQRHQLFPKCYTITKKWLIYLNHLRQVVKLLYYASLVFVLRGVLFDLIIFCLGPLESITRIFLFGIVSFKTITMRLTHINHITYRLPMGKPRSRCPLEHGRRANHLHLRHRAHGIYTSRTRDHRSPMTTGKYLREKELCFLWDRWQDSGIGLDLFLQALAPTSGRNKWPGYKRPSCFRHWTRTD